MEALVRAPRVPAVRTPYGYFVYALFRGDVVVYVGSSINVEDRVQTHLRQGEKAFDSYSFVSVNSVEEMHKLELFSIAAFDPEYNGNPSGTVQASGFVGPMSGKKITGLPPKRLAAFAEKHGVDVVVVKGTPFYRRSALVEAMEGLA